MTLPLVGPALISYFCLSMVFLQSERFCPENVQKQTHTHTPTSIPTHTHDRSHFPCLSLDEWGSDRSLFDLGILRPQCATLQAAEREEAQTCRTKISPASLVKNTQLKVEKEMVSSHLFMSEVFWSQVGGRGSKQIFLIILTSKCKAVVELSRLTAVLHTTDQ